MPALFYCTPRALLIKYLHEKTDTTLVNWSEKNKTFRVQCEQFYFTWLKIARPDRYKEEEHRADQVDIADFLEFEANFFGSAYLDKKRSTIIEYVSIVRKSTEKRMVVNDFVGTKLFEWIIQLLLEQTRIDWIQWTDKDSLSFQLLDIDGLAQMYTKVQKTMTTTPSYYIKLLLSSYCSTGLLIAVDKKNHCYQFNKEWYEREKERKVEDKPEHNEDELIRISYIEFPEETDFKDQYVL